MKCKFCKTKFIPKVFLKNYCCNTSECTQAFVEFQKQKKKGIKPLSDKRKLQNDLYLKLRKIYLEKNPICEVKMKGCTGVATECHHSLGRVGTLLTDIRHLVAICRNCHLIVEKENL